MLWNCNWITDDVASFDILTVNPNLINLWSVYFSLMYVVEWHRESPDILLTDHEHAQSAMPEPESKCVFKSVFERELAYV